MKTAKLDLTKLKSGSSHLLCHLARKQIGIILQLPSQLHCINYY